MKAGEDASVVMRFTLLAEFMSITSACMMVAVYCAVCSWIYCRQYLDSSSTKKNFRSFYCCQIMLLTSRKMEQVQACESRLMLRERF